MQITFPAITVAASGITAQSPVASTASVAQALPVNAAGASARYVAVSAAVRTHIVFGTSSVAATALHLPVPQDSIQIFNVSGMSHVSVFQATPGACTILPLEDA